MTFILVQTGWSLALFDYDARLWAVQRARGHLSRPYHEGPDSRDTGNFTVLLPRIVLRSIRKRNFE